MLAESVFFAGVIFMINARDDAFRSYHTLNNRYDTLSRAVLFRLYENTFDALQYFGRYRPAFRILTDLVLTGLEVYYYFEID